MNLLIGYPVDKPTTPREQQFLPDYLAKAITSATIAQDGKNTLISVESKNVANTTSDSKSIFITHFLNTFLAHYFYLHLFCLLLI
jgi:hypothetical protein